jgi:hypothetical protein
MKVLVTSPMRTGSTWVHEVLVDMIKPKNRDFVWKTSDMVRALETSETFVLKSHKWFDFTSADFRGKLHSIRVLRNFKDSLISRSL